MNMKNYQNIVIGAGSGGLTVASGLANLGKQVLLVEASHVGGDCTNVGCVPSKTLIHLAKQFHPGMDANQVLAEVTRKRNWLRDKETEEMQHHPNIDFVQGYAKFVSANEIEVTGPDESVQHFNADRFFIATGARPRIVEVPGLAAEQILTNESIFDLTRLPHHLAIIGAGIIAIELAFAFRKLGAKVTLISLDERVLPRYPLEVSQAIQPELEKRGIRVHFQATSDHYEEDTRTLFARRHDEVFPIEDVDQVLLAIGRVRNIDHLDLEKAGVDFDRRGIKIDGFGRTNVKGIYAIGDVTPTSAFTHSANAQGRRVVQKVLYPFLPASKKEPLYPTSTFSDPEIATVGMTRHQIEEKFHPHLTLSLRIDLKEIDRGYTDDVEHGFILLDVMRLTGRILGATIVAPQASEMISLFTLAITRRVSMYKLYRQVYPYPTFSSAIQKISDAFMRETLPHIMREFKTYLRYRIFG